MKMKLAASGMMAIALCGTLSASAQPTADQTTPQQPPSEVTSGTTTDNTTGVSNSDMTGMDHTNHMGMSHKKWSGMGMGMVQRADKIIGREVVSQDQMKLGRVKDLAIDLKNGRVVEVIVGRGGMLGMDQKYVAIPPSAFTCDPDKKDMMLNADPMKFKESPSFKLSAWDSNVRDSKVDESYTYYGSKSYYGSNQMDHGNNAMPMRMGQLQRADKLIGTTVYDMQNNRLGRVNELMVDLKMGRVVEVIVSTGGILGMGGDMSAVPPQAFHWMDSDTLVLDTTKDHLMNSPRFKSSQWPDFNDTNHVTSVYRAYNVQPYYAVGMGGEGMTNGATNYVTAMDQGNNREDMMVTQKIRQTLMATDGLSMRAKNIKIITKDNHVTLLGTVVNDGEKMKIDQIARDGANGGTVDDQLQVQPQTTAVDNSQINSK